MTGCGSVGGMLRSSVRSVQYLKEEDDAVVPSDLKYRKEFETGCPWRSEYIPVRDVRIPFAVCEIRTVWLFVISVPLLRMKLSRCGICSRSDGTFGLSRKRWTLSKTMEITCLMLPLAECSWQSDEAASVRDTPPPPLERACAATMLAATRHASAKAPRAPVLRLRVMLSPFDLTSAP